RKHIGECERTVWRARRPHAGGGNAQSIPRSGNGKIADHGEANRNLSLHSCRGVTGMTSGPLRDLVVLDFGQLLAGPFATTLLADFGATTSKIERPGKGDALRDFGPSGVEGPIWWRSINRNKKSLALDWKRPESRKILERLIRRADVMVENFRAGVLESNGLGPDILHQWNPQLILLRVSGYGQSGPYHKMPGFGKAAEAFSGF